MKVNKKKTKPKFSNNGKLIQSGRRRKQKYQQNVPAMHNKTQTNGAGKTNGDSYFSIAHIN